MKGFMQSIGLSNYCIDLNDLSENVLSDKFQQLEVNHDAYEKKLQDIHSDMKCQAYKSTAEVIKFLERGQC